MSALRHLRWVALLEGLSFLLLLFVAMPLKYLAGQPLAVKVVGMAHGILFIAFLAALARVHVTRGWGIGRSGLALLSSLVPFGTFALDVSLKRELAQTGVRHG